MPCSLFFLVSRLFFVFLARRSERDGGGTKQHNTGNGEKQVSGLLAMKAAIIALIALAFGLSVANAQQTGLLLSQVGGRGGRAVSI